MNLISRAKILFTEMYRLLNQKQKRILIGAAISLLVFLICHRVYRTAAEKKVYYNNRSQEVTAQNKLREELYRLDSEKENYEASIVLRDDIDSFKNKLLKLASISGIKVVSISSRKSPSPADYNIFFTTLEIRCSYHQLGNFVSRIESAEPYIGIESIKLASAGVRSVTQIPEPAEAKLLLEVDTVAHVNIVLETYSSRK